MKLAITCCALLLVASASSAQTAVQPRTNANTRKTARRTPAKSATQKEIESLRVLIEQQQQATQQQLDLLKQQVAQRDAEIQQLRQSVQQAQSAATQAQSKAAEVQAAAEPLQSEVAGVKANANTVALHLDQAEKKVGDMVEHPAAIHYKGITITPGGFLELGMVVRNRNENSSLSSAPGDGNIPFPGSANGTLSEFRFDARHSRMSMKAEGKLGSAKLTGYYEMDFLGAAPTANENQSNSFNMRQRQLWGMVNFANGWSVTGGQQWSLFTLTRKAMENGGEFQPLVVNPQYMIGFDWTRQPGVRVVKNFNNRLWAGFAVENSSMVLSASSFGAAAPALVITGAPGNNITLGGIPIYGFNASANAISPNGNFTLANTPGANGVSTNVAPDLIAKLTFEPGWGHFEIKGMARFFRDRYAGQNNTAVGGGLGLAAILPLVKSKFDFVAQGSLGNGIGRYGSGGGWDVTLKPDGSVRPIRSYHALFGPELHIGKNLDIYGYVGSEYYQRTVSLVSPTSGVGYGNPFANNTGCYLQQTTSTAVPACAGNTRAAWELSPGFLYRFYKGTAGTVQFGVQYSYSERALWSGNGGLPAGSPGAGPSANVSQVMSSFRYVLP